jgi:hypothetical protein
LSQGRENCPYGHLINDIGEGNYLQKDLAECAPTIATHQGGFWMVVLQPEIQMLTCLRTMEWAGLLSPWLQLPPTVYQ